MVRVSWLLPVVSALAFGVAAPAAPHAMELRLGTEPYSYTVIDQDLRLALREFGANLGVRVALSDGVQGRIRGRLPPLAPRDFLSRVTEIYGLDWYFDGYTIAVTAQAEGVSRVLSTAGAGVAQVKAGLEALQVADARFVARAEGLGGELMLVAGPPRYVQLVEQATAELVARAARVPPPAPIPVAAPPPPRAEPPRPGGVRVFRAGQEQRVTFDGP